MKSEQEIRERLEREQDIDPVSQRAEIVNRNVIETLEWVLDDE